MENLKIKIQNFNKVFRKDFEHYCLKILDDDLEASKALMASRFANAFPQELKAFYEKLGGVKTDFDFAESFAVHIPTLKTLTTNLGKEGKYDTLVSMGLIDQIMFSWGNDRWEFEEEIAVEHRNFLNENYRCFGFYRYDHGLNAAYYLYFDKAGKFGEIHYDQDSFEELWADTLKPMLLKSPATENLEAMLCRILARLEIGIREREEIA